MGTSTSSKKDLDFQAVFTATAIPSVILDLGLVIVEVNDAFLQASKRSRDDLLGKYVFETFPPNPDDPQADGVTNLHRSFLRVLQHGVADTMEVQKYDIPIGNIADGKFEEHYWKPINTPVFDGDGKLTHILHNVEDITSQVQAERALRESERRFRALTNATADVIYRMSPDWKFMHELDGRGFLKDTTELREYRMEDYVHPDDLELGRKTIEEAIRNKTVFELEHRVVRADGSYGWTYSRAVPLLGPDGEIQEWIGAAVDTTDRKQAEEKTRHASLHDSLTGLPNRAMLYEYASHLLPHNSRNNQSTAVLFFDLDRFKPINDTHGHDVGDVVLKEVANRIRRCVRAGDVAVRFGGDEFVVLLHDIKAAASAAETTRHIVAEINQPYHVGDLSLSASVGISVFPTDGMDIGTLISNADMAMYQAKQSGRNNFQFYSTESAAGTKLQAAIEQQLKSALSDDAFHLFYQPVLDVKTGEIVSVEALLRWRNTDIGPDQFVPIAEATGMINPIGRWLLEEASWQYKTWLDRGLQAIPIAVNVSVVEFRDKDFVSRFETVMRKHGINCNALQVEVTETAVMDDVEHAVTLLSRLKALGVTVLLDDFGTGHSSLAYLARLPLTKVKIDKSFIARLTSDLASRAVADAMIALSRTLNLEVVAEGIESQDALDYVYSHGCTQAQGYYLGKPMSGEYFESWYWAHRERIAAYGPSLMPAQ